MLGDCKKPANSKVKKKESATTNKNHKVSRVQIIKSNMLITVDLIDGNKQFFAVGNRGLEVCVVSYAGQFHMRLSDGYVHNGPTSTPWKFRVCAIPDTYSNWQEYPTDNWDNYVWPDYPPIVGGITPRRHYIDFLWTSSQCVKSSVNLFIEARE